MALNSPILSWYWSAYRSGGNVNITGSPRLEGIFLQLLKVLPDIPGPLIIEAIKALPGIRWRA
jgi:hypothetical protein